MYSRIAIFVLIVFVSQGAQAQREIEDVFSKLTSFSLEYTEECRVHVSLPVAANAPARLKWKMWESPRGRRCQAFEISEAGDSLYEEFGFDGDRSFLFRPADSGKLVVQKGNNVGHQTLLRMRNPLYLLFPAAYFTIVSNKKDPAYVPLLSELNTSKPAALNGAIQDKAQILFTSPLILNRKEVSEKTGELSVNCSFMNAVNTNPSDNKFTLVQGAGLPFPLGWSMQIDDRDGGRAITYEVLELQEIEIANGKKIPFPRKTRLSFFIAGGLFSDATYTISTAELNGDNVDALVDFDPSIASIIEDVDEAAIVKVPR